MTRPGLGKCEESLSVRWSGEVASAIELDATVAADDSLRGDEVVRSVLPPVAFGAGEREEICIGLVLNGRFQPVQC